MSEELWMTCQRNPKWAAVRIETLEAKLSAAEAKLAALTAPGEYGDLILRLRKTYPAGPGTEAATAIEQLQAKLAEYREDAERLLTALDDSTALLRRVKDENDEGGIADQIADNITAMKGKP